MPISIRMSSLPVFILTAATAVHGGAATPEQPRLALNCDQFVHLDNGNWQGKPGALVTFQGSTFRFGGTVFRPGEVVVDGVAMKTRLDAQCLPSKK